jgi:NADH-quinone oxidoreductase subunit N
MAGIPPLAGFFGKYFVIQSLIQTYTWLTIIMILTSVVGMYYYLKVIMTMYSPSDKSIQIEESNRWFLSIATIAMVLMFFAVQWL